MICRKVLFFILAYHLHLAASVEAVGKKPSEETCKAKVKIFAYQDSQVEWKNSPADLWPWLVSQKAKHVVTFCPSDAIIAQDENDCTTPPFRLIEGPFDCSPQKGRSWVHFKGQQGYDKEQLPKGFGRMVSGKDPEEPDGDGAGIARPCFDMVRGIDQVTGRFIKGQPEGKASVKFFDGVQLEGTVKKGAINGKVKLFDKRDNILALGLYRAGRPHGPFWIFAPDGEQVVFVHFDNGELVEENVILLDFEAEWGMKGKLVNNSYLEDAQKIDLDWVAEYKCLQVIHIPKEESQEEKTTIKLPVKIYAHPLEQRVIVRPSKMLYFNRVAKTGSQSFIALFTRLADNLGYEVLPKIMQRETVGDHLEGIIREVDSVTAINKPTIIVRHYNFVDFPKYGSLWRPDWFSMVRDPIDKIVSWFYYWRAAWNIVERQKRYPDEPLPDPAFLKLDFDTCVLTSDPECQFIQYDDVEKYADHRSQVMQFCGHDPICRSFNHPLALQIAKANVEQFYSVVGVTELMNMTLSVAEAKMPEYFEGATKTYYTDPEVKKFEMKNAYKLPVSEKVMSLIRANFTHEIEFYEFCKQRLQQQFEDVKK